MEEVNNQTATNTKRRPSFQLKVPDIVAKLKQFSQVNISTMQYIISQVTPILKNQPNMLQLQGPITILGDIHGQFYDLLNIFQKFMNFDKQKCLFLGDYVDRGMFGVEVITLLLVYKILYPKNVYLLRGNHECRSMTSTFNFRIQCLAKYNQHIYEDFMFLFDLLPVCAIIDQTYFAVHGGISPHCPTLAEIQKINRFCEVPLNGSMCDLLWSDPSHDLKDKWKANVGRQCSYFFGPMQAQTFLTKNGLRLIIRGHEVENEGYKYQKFMSDPVTLTIFSAPNYGNTYRNKGCIAKIRGSSVQLKSYSEVQHPLVLPNFQNVFEWSMPKLAECVTTMMAKLLKTVKKKKSTVTEKLEKKEKNVLNFFESDYEILQRVEIIDKIFEEASYKIQKSNSMKEEIKAYKEGPKYSIDQFIEIKNKDKSEQRPAEAAVIGPKLCRISSMLSFQSVRTFREFEEEPTPQENCD